jgi:predicted patatin/cPLA2 family phospholipase
MSAGPPLYYGTNPDAAIHHIQTRAAARMLDPSARDERKLGLAVEGGSMRGVLSGGGAVALSHLGFNGLFDEVYATSAGVMNVAYFLSRQAELGITVYYEDIADRRFWSPRRFWKMLDVDYLFRDVVTRQKPLDIEAVLRSPTRLMVAAINARVGEGALLDTRTTKTPLLQVLKAATAMPILYNRTVEVDGTPYVDGGLAIPFPLKQAIDRGCTDILVLLTRPPSYRSPEPTRNQRFLFRRLVRGNKAKMGLLYDHHPEVANAYRDLALGTSKPDRPVNIVTVCPELPELIHRTTRDPEALRAAAVDFGRKVLRAFNADAEAWTLDAVKRPS